MYKKHKRTILKAVAWTVLAGSLLLNFPVVRAATVNDLNKASTYAREAVQWMADNDIISGDTKGNFNPRKTVSRAELVTLLVKALGIDMSNLPATATFSDVPVNHWSFRYVEAANKAGIVSGVGNGKFGINNQCTREQITTMILNYLAVSKEAILSEQGIDGLSKYKDQGKMSDWAKPSIQFAVSNNIMSGMSTDTFSPDGSATKEQIAVILYKFLNSRENIQQSADTLRKIITTYNGDIVKLTTSPVISGNEVMVPVELFEKTGSVADVQANSIIIKSSRTQDKNIYMNIGSNSAYVNYEGTGDPFSDPAAQDKLITLNNAPEKAGEQIFIPAGAVANALGITMDWNPKINLLKLQDISAVRNPMLYNAMKSVLDYKGEYTSNISMSMKENTYNQEFGIQVSMQGAVNGLNSTSKSVFSMEFNGESGEPMAYDTINIGNVIYSKNSETGTWNTYTRNQADDEGIMYYDVEKDRNELLRLLDAYGKMNISYAGKTSLNGQEVTKYQVKLGMDILEGMASADMLEFGLGIDDIYNKGLDCRMELFVNSSGQLVKQLVIISGGIEVDGVQTDVKVTVSSEYTNIGKEIEIVRPI
jgi:hypothetical protein